MLKSKQPYLLLFEGKKQIRTNKFASGNFFVCVCFFKQKRLSYTFDLWGRVGDKNFFTQPISGNKTTFFWSQISNKDTGLKYELLTKLAIKKLCQHQ